MKTRSAPRRQQSGAALLMLLAALILAGGYAFYRSANLGPNRTQQITHLATSLARAKEALIARAVIDANRPGSLPCPDLITNDATNKPGDGNTDKFIGAATGECPSYVGWLPWVTLDLPELTDDSGTRLWYSLTRNLRDDDSAYPINSDTLTDLRIDGGGEIAAIIIAPGSALSGQSRPSNTPADYLEGDNANADVNYISGPAGPAFNDIVTVITRQELMAAVEKRVANELKSCIEQYALAGNKYPWPAPFSSSNFRGKSGSYFGQLPSTQPGAGTDAALKQNIQQTQDASNALSSATLASDQLAAVQTLAEALTQARNIYDTIYSASTKLWQVASVTAGNSTALNIELTTDLQDGRIKGQPDSNSEFSRIRSKAATVNTQIDTLSSELNNIGIDVFPNQLKTRALISAAAVEQLLANSTTTHADIGPALANAQAASLATPFSQSTLTTAIKQLQNTITSSRINRHYSEISPYPTQLVNLNSQLSSTPNTTTSAVLAAKLIETKTVLESIQTSATAINAARSSSLLAVGQALAAAQASIDYPLINSNTSSAVSAIDSLVNTMIVNDDNLTRTSLTSAVSDFKTQQAIFAALTITSTTDRVPYAINLQTVTVDVKFWADIIVAEADSLARQAKGLPVAAGVDLSTVTPLATSAYQIATDALSSSQNSVTALQAYINAPTALKQGQASSALADTLAATNTAINSASALEASLNSGAAAALPITWLSSKCDVFREGADSWWNKNQWRTLVFYQISEATRSAAPGTLKVNQAGTYKLVVINAARQLAGQNRATLATANYFEGINADTTRDGDASAPVGNFIHQPPSASFNDRLAY